MIQSKTKNILFKPLKLSRLTLIILGLVFSLSCVVSIFNFTFLINYNNKLQVYTNTVEANSNLANHLINNEPVPLPPSVPNETLSSIVGAISSLVEKTDNKPVEVVPVNAVIVLNSFGDHFSGLSFINETKTNMNWDQNSTAFTFPPLYTFTKNSQPVKFDNSGSASLKVLNNKLYYLGNKVELPAEVKKENILNINVSLIGDKWLVGIVTGKTTDERGWVYFFNGKVFIPVITAATSQKIEPRFSRTGGTIAFGGTENDFLIVYGGYDGHAFYYSKGTLTDVSNLFSLRVSAAGFEPQIISRENSRGTLFYICSKTDGKPKLIKFWPKKKGELMGSLDFTPLIFSDSLGAKSAACQISGSEILMNVKKNDGNLEAWTFKDNGFDNSKSREVVSFDIGQNRDQKIKSAIISEIDLFSDIDTTELFFANQENKWQKINPYVWQELSASTKSLFWRATFKSEPGSPDYSPWFDDINRLDYKTY